MAFDAGSYLRGQGERLVGGKAGDGQLGSSPLASAAAALVAVRALSAQEAERVLDEFDLSWDVGFRDSRPGSRSPSHRVGYISLDRLSDARVCALGAEVMLPAGTLRLRYAVLEQDHTALFADFHVRGTSTGLHDWIRVPSGMPSGLARPELTDESGMTRTLEFNGHGNDDRWSGQFSTSTAIALDASWIELYGTRLELKGPPAPTPVAIAPVQSEDRPQMHLLRVLASADPFRSQDPRAASDALLAAGAITPEDPVVAQINAATADEQHRRSSLAYPSKLTGLPAPWPASRASDVEGPDGMIITGVTTDEFDGHRVAVLALRSGPSGFVVEAEATSTGSEHSILKDDELVWWARDDRGQSYLGTWDGWSRRTASGELAFFPQLDPEARRLDLIPSTPTKRAVIGVGLAWEPPNA